MAVLFAVLLPVALGAMALGAETGYWHFSQRELQHAADVAAHAAAVRKRGGDAESDIEATALRIATEAGFSPEIGTIAVHTPPQTGPNTGDVDFVEVVLSETIPRLVSSLYSEEPVRIGGRAVAEITEGSAACVIALSPTASGAVTVSGSTTVTINGCSVASNSNALDALSMQGGARLTTDCVYTVGESVTTSSLTLNTCESVREYAPVVTDPYADLAEPALSGSCKPKTVSNTTLTPVDSHPSGLKVMRFCGGLDVNGTVTFSPGLYIVESGSFAINANAVVSGSEVVFYLANGASLKFNSGATINFSARTSDPYSGILFFGQRGGANVTHQVNGAAGTTFDGAVYFPSGDLQYAGRAGSTGGCTQIIANTVTFTGNSEVKSDCQAAGTRTIATNQLVRIVE